MESIERNDAFEYFNHLSKLDLERRREDNRRSRNNSVGNPKRKVENVSKKSMPSQDFKKSFIAILVVSLIATTAIATTIGYNIGQGQTIDDAYVYISDDMLEEKVIELKKADIEAKIASLGISQDRVVQVLTGAGTIEEYEQIKGIKDNLYMLVLISECYFQNNTPGFYSFVEKATGSNFDDILISKEYYAKHGDQYGRVDQNKAMGFEAACDFCKYKNSLTEQEYEMNARMMLTNEVHK